MRKFRNSIGIQNPKKHTEPYLGLEFYSFAVA